MIQKFIFIAINIVFGSLVLFSYYNGLNREPQLSLKLWGGVPKSLQPFIVSCMFAGAIGYFFFTSHLLFNVDANNFKLSLNSE